MISCVDVSYYLFFSLDIILTGDSIFTCVFILQGSGRSVIFYLMLRFHFLATLLVQLKTKFGLQKLLFWCVAALSSKPLIIKTI
uniref:Uncharacterized protein n=1 Tax=Triticum urartu TaxID=4572 RepID=A0A8R7TPD0_TRIUA